jgi:hypothetical protein
MNLYQNKTYIKNNNEYQFFDVRDESLASDLFTNTYPTNTTYDGYVNYGLEKILLMNKFDASQVTQLYTRLNTITSKINQLKTEIINYQNQNASARPTTIDLALNSVKLLPKDLDKKLKLLLHEYYEIIYYLEMCGATDISPSQTNRLFTEYQGVKPDEAHIIVSFVVDTNAETSGRILFTETYNDKYWINIDHEQSCSMDKEASVKILASVEYNCLDKNRLDVPRQISAQPDSVGFTWIDNVEHEGMTVQDFRTITGHVKYTITDQKLDQEKAKYPNITQWSSKDEAAYRVERNFFINNLGESINSLILATYTYIVPKVDTEKTDTIESDNNINTKVYNIFNLDDINQLKVKFKRIPRKLKESDTDYEVYVPNQYGQLTKSLLPNPGGPYDTNMKIWKCFDRVTGQDTPIPAYYTMLNEMVFRSFFGSADASEHGGKEIMESKEDNGWIPYG